MLGFWVVMASVNFLLLPVGLVFLVQLRPSAFLTPAPVHDEIPAKVDICVNCITGVDRGGLGGKGVRADARLAQGKRFSKA